MIRFVNGNIITMQAPADRATELCVEGDTFAEPGSTHVETTIDLGGRTVIPGFCDAHTHFYYWAASLNHLQMEGASSVDEALLLVAEAASRTRCSARIASMPTPGPACKREPTWTR